MTPRRRGALPLVLLLTLGACSRGPFTLRLGKDARAKDEVEIELAPLAKYDGLKRQDVYDLRAAALARHPELYRGAYAPEVHVLGSIEDGRPWWGLEGLYFYGAGPRSVEGPSEESRFIPNPFLLAGVRETVARSGESPDGSRDYQPVPTRLTWDARGAKARVDYAVSRHFAFTESHGYPPELARELQLVLYNARDLGFLYFGIDPAASKGVRQEKDAGRPSFLGQIIHCGNSCGAATCCNNMSPFGREYMIQVPALPAEAVVKLWRGKPTSMAEPADMTVTVVLR